MFNFPTAAFLILTLALHATAQSVSTNIPTEAPTGIPTSKPTPEPSPVPTLAPTDVPTNPLPVIPSGSNAAVLTVAAVQLSMAIDEFLANIAIQKAAWGALAGILADFVSFPNVRSSRRRLDSYELPDRRMLQGGVVFDVQYDIVLGSGNSFSNLDTALKTIEQSVIAATASGCSGPNCIVAQLVAAAAAAGVNTALFSSLTVTPVSANAFVITIEPAFQDSTDKSKIGLIVGLCVAGAVLFIGFVAYCMHELGGSGGGGSGFGGGMFSGGMMPSPGKGLVSRLPPALSSDL